MMIDDGAFSRATGPRADTRSHDAAMNDSAYWHRELQSCMPRIVSTHIALTEVMASRRDCD